MRNTFLVETLKWLSPEDMEDLSLFVQSDFHNRSNAKVEIIRLFAFLKTQFPAFNEEEIEKDKVYQFIYPNTHRIASKLEKLISDLYKIVKDYLLWKHYQKPEQEFNRSLDWALVLKDYAVNEKFEATLQKIEKDYLHPGAASPLQFFQRYQLENTRQEWMSWMNKGKADINLNNTINSLFVFFEVYRYEFLNQLLLQQKLTNVEIPEHIERIVQNNISLIPDDNNIILRLSKKIYKLLSDTSIHLDDFETLMADLKEHEPAIAPEMVKKYYTYLRNICTLLLLKSNNADLLGVQYKLLRENLDRGYLYHNGKLHTTTLANITRISIVTGNVAWAMECIEAHKDKMFGDIETNDYYDINKALCLFERQQYAAVLDLLPPSSPNVFYHLIARRLELMCYFELQSDLLHHKLEAFKVHIWRASEKYLSETLKDGNKAFVNLLIQLVAIPPGDKEKLARLERRIKEKTHVAESRWLLSKVAI